MTETASTEPVKQELARRQATQGELNALELIERNTAALDAALGDVMTVAQFKTAAWTYLRQNPKLGECDPYSVVGGLRLGAQLGLQLGPLGHFYLAPFSGQATFILGYKGMIELAYRSDKVKDVRAGLVREGDRFDFRYGSRPFLDHTPDGGAGEREIVAGYAVARTTTGGAPFVVLYDDDFEAARKASQMGKQGKGMWADFPNQAKLKTCVRRLQTWLPQTRESALAVERDETDVPLVDEAWKDGTVYVGTTGSTYAQAVDSFLKERGKR